MTLRNPYILSALAAATCVACAPLSQAPLVYTSKQQFGLSVSTSATETSGFEVNLGYKLLDAAYVPVAVAPPCAPSEKKDCSDHKIEQIFGQHDEKSEDGPALETISKAKEARASADRTLDAANADYTKAKSDLAAAEIAERAAQKSEKDVEKLRAAAQALAEGSPERSAADETLQGAETSRKAELAEAATKAERTNAQEVSRLAVVRAEKARNDADDELRLLEQKRASSGAKKDAYSVFGSFDSRNKVGVDDKVKGTVGVSFGKVFSTGVAAQNLSRDALAQLPALATSGCLDRVHELAETIKSDETKKANTIASGVAACAASATNAASARRR